MNLASKIFSKNTINYYNKKILFMGPDNKLTTENFLLSRMLFDIIIFIVLLFIPRYGLLIAILGTLAFHYAYKYFLIDEKIRERSNDLYDEALIFFELIKLSYKETHNIYKSLDLIAHKLNNSLAKQLKYIMIKDKYTEDLNIVFKRFIETIPNEDVRVSLIDLSASNDYELTLTKIINNISKKDILLIKQKYNKLPFVLSIVSIMLIILIILLLIFMPNIINFFK